ncbi:hypothetical protein [Alteribacter salitolerans]|nr:hypothetical protein [Alteribacter salitolerans]
MWKKLVVIAFVTGFISAGTFSVTDAQAVIDTLPQDLPYES